MDQFGGKRNFLISYLLFIAFLFFTENISYAQDNDTVKWYKTKAFRTLAVPSVLIGYGVSTIGNNGLLYSSKDAQKDIAANFKGFHTQADDYLVFAPIVSVYALNLSGIKGRHSYLDVTLLYSLSLATSSAITFSLKSSTHVLRPDNSVHNSFPSGHTSSVFVAAEVMHQEFKDQSPWISVAGYTIGAGTGLLRMLNNRHWMSDVFVGAGIGILTTRITYLYYPWVQEKILKNKNKNIGLAPMIFKKGGGIALVYMVK